MNPTATERRYTPEDLLTMPDGDRYELIDGELVENDTGWNASWISGQIYFFLSQYCREHKLGLVAPPDATYQCFPDDAGKVRKPDGSFIRFERLPPPEQREGHCRVAPDLAVEVVSPHDLFSEVARKVDEYLAAGVRLVWVVDPPSRTVRVYRHDGHSAAVLHERDELNGEDVLPGFACPVAKIFAEPTP